MKSPNRVRVTAFLFAAVLTGGVASASTSPGRAAPASHFLITVTPSGQGRLSQRSLVEIVSRSGGLERVVAPASSAYPYQAAFSPDGSRIAWAASDGVHVENRDGTDARIVVSASAACRKRCAVFSFAWAPDSGALAVGGAGDRNNELLLVPLDGSSSTPLAPALPSGTYETEFWTADGSLVYLSRVATGDIAVPGCCHVDLDVTTPATAETRTLFTTGDVSSPSALPLLSPDLRYHATIRETDRQLRYQLRVLDTATGRTRVLDYVNPADAGYVVWSPDARTLAVVEQEGGWHVVTVDIASRKVRQVGRGLGVSYSRDGELLIVRGSGFDELWSSEDGKPQRRLFRTPGRQHLLTVDAD